MEMVVETAVTGDRNLALQTLLLDPMINDIDVAKAILADFLREFAEYRFLLYGIALILVMRWRPEGLMPSKVGRQEMHHDEPANETAAEEGGTSGAGD